VLLQRGGDSSRGGEKEARIRQGILFNRKRIQMRRSWAAMLPAQAHKGIISIGANLDDKLAMIKNVRFGTVFSWTNGSSFGFSRGIRNSSVRRSCGSKTHANGWVIVHISYNMMKSARLFSSARITSKLK
jgi:hypothetical protein